MLKACRHGDHDIRDRWAYLAYAQEAADKAAEALVVGNIGGMRLCRPKEATGGEVHDVITQFLEAHPAQRWHGATNLAVKAFAAAWPCP